MIRRQARSKTLGVTLQFPLQLDVRGGLLLAVDEAAVESNIVAIIEAVRGSHLMEPWFGIISLPFLPLTQPGGLCELIKAAIRLGEDRIEPDFLDVRAQTGALDSGVMPLAISYIIRNRATPNHFVYGFRALNQVVS